MKLYVGNLSYSTTEDTLKTLFSNYAEVTSVSILKDKFTEQSKGFGFIEIEDEDKAQRAIGGMNGKEVDGRRIRVSEAVDHPSHGHGGARKFFKSNRDGFNRSDREHSGRFDRSERPSRDDRAPRSENSERTERKSEEY